MLADGAIPPVIEALSLVGKRKEMPRCTQLVRDHADLLTNAERHREAADLLGTALLQGASPGELSGPLLAAAEAAYSSEGWWERFSNLCDLKPGTSDVRKAWGLFSRLLALKEGSAVYHASGWGVGRVESLDLLGGEIEVRFQAGKRDRFPIASALDIFDFLPENDLRALLVSDPDELKRILKEEPLEALKAILARYENRGTHPQLKTALAQLGVDGSAFTAWWRKTKKAAETSHWFDITGTGTKTVLRVLSDAADPVQTLHRQLKRSRSLGDALKRARELLSGTTVDDSLRDAALSTLVTMSQDPGHNEIHRLSTWCFLREQTGSSPEPLRELLQEAASAPQPTNPADPPAVWAIFSNLPTAREQEIGVELLREIYPGDIWVEEAARNFAHAAPGMVRPLSDALRTEGRHEDLAEQYRTLLARPTRNPHALIALAEMAENGKFTGEFPPETQRLESLLRLAGYLHANRNRDTATGRARSRLTTQLRGPKGLMRKLLENAGRSSFQTMQVLIERGVEPSLDNEFTSIAVARFPDFFSKGERPFWEGTDIWTTRRGLERREAELTELKEVKIPENSEAIGKAASFGDLSENSEWEAAIEEQRNLTDRAAELELELRETAFLEDAPIQDGVASPGTRVRILDLSSGEESNASIVGPWDTGDYEDAMSYRAPMAAGLLGRKVGEQVRVILPTGSVEIKLLAVEPLVFRT